MAKLTSSATIDFAKFNRQARFVVINAESQADLLDSKEVCPEHLLLALVSRTNLTSARMLSNWGLDSDLVLAAVKENFVPKRAGRHCQMRIAKAAKEVLLGAMSQAKALGSEEVGSEHILLSLLAYSNYDVSMLLKAFGITPFGLLGTMSDIGVKVGTHQRERSIKIAPEPTASPASEAETSLRPRQLPVMVSNYENGKQQVSQHESVAVAVSEPISVTGKPSLETVSGYAEPSVQVLINDWSVKGPTPVSFEEVIFPTVPKEDLSFAPQMLKKRRRNLRPAMASMAAALLVAVGVGSAVIMNQVGLPQGLSASVTTSVQSLPQASANSGTTTAGLNRVKATEPKLPRLSELKFGESTYHPELATGSLVGVNQTLEAPAGANPITYDVALDEGIGLDGAALGKAIFDVINDQRGWAADGFTASQVPSGGQFHFFILPVKGINEKCGEVGLNEDGGCVVGRNIYLPASRLVDGDNTFKERGGSLTDYRVYLISRHLGLALGFGSAECHQEGAVASVMYPQTESSSACVANGWPHPEN